MKPRVNIFWIIACIVFIVLPLLSVSCKKKQPANTDKATDYSIAAHWLNIPAAIKPVDVFYLYPTVWTPDSVTNPLYSEIDDPCMITGSAYVFSEQATAFETTGNIYAPYYRQANAL